MEISLFAVLAVFVVLQGATILLTLFLASRGTGLVLDLFQELDEKLAGAIKGLWRLAVLQESSQSIRFNK